MFSSRAEYLLVESNDLLMTGKVCGVLGGIGKQVVNFFEAEVLAIVVRFGHF